MKISEARALDAQGKLKRKVLTEEGWYLPRYTPETAPEREAPPPRILPPAKPRRTAAKKAA
jgi:hypothetical protein